jgi:hypothetical protein
METHAHELHKAPGHGWKHYLFEFFMLFLAVTLGFYAENLREGAKNKQEVNEDIKSVLADLESDVAHLSTVLEANAYSYTSADSLLILLHNDISNTQKIYLYARTTTANIEPFYANSKTFDQMKASGMLKLIRPRNLLDSLGLYYATFHFLSEQDHIIQLKMDDVHKGNHLLFDTYIFSQMRVGYDSVNRSRTFIDAPAGNPALLSTDAKNINEVALNYYYLSSSEKFQSRLGERQKQFASRLIELIKKEYHLKNE